MSPEFQHPPIVLRALTTCLCSLTPISTVVSGYVRLLDDESLTGQAIECTRDKHFFFPDPPLLDGRHTKRSVTVWDPLFKLMHGENSGLPDAIPGEDLKLQ